ncbi:MAG: type I-E CRISPR-associated protein Cas7/Cse4/CasC [Alphaproteobacteria bacterium]|nr:type I-E CRISPR-associated protein Cas7/Cse4/CasC [Alphaproteobacteria bacterium]MBU0799073.1 type I-E CRISPR-associated protein Cas7/Cse4/CasC [Alphaproteobacteria bacterium]MBU0885595.1 type I-E CRISPR-associated protein Cas7/Cse4/CasC [Alphaproteobacteria bacterium]MBU1813750.1 type I-E CRISPR-associated protein Cas7/Cse4/CasC [Alphaproteobacteria bacterium]
MTPPRFLQIHTLHSYTAALLNRDDTGQAKRLVYGGDVRTRISSQCLKRHWRMAADDPHALQTLTDYVASFRSRELVTEKVIKPLLGRYPEEVVQALEPAFQQLVYGKNADKGKKSRQTLLLGQPELDWLAGQAERIASEFADAKAAEKAVADWTKDKNFKAMAENASLPGGIAAALFGRMVTSDPAANIDAPVHVAHAFTVHKSESEDDYFTAVDDLSEDEPGADTIQETELTSGLYYGYAVIDMPGLIGNCGGDRDLASRIVHNLIHLIAEVSPGAKLGSTAPYGRAGMMLIEAGARQPRSLASAYRKAVRHDFDKARDALQDELNRYDESYATGEARRHLCVDGALDGIEKLALTPLAEWAAARVPGAPDA